MTQQGMEKKELAKLSSEVAWEGDGARWGWERNVEKRILFT